MSMDERAGPLSFPLQSAQEPNLAPSFGRKIPAVAHAFRSGPRWARSFRVTGRQDDSMASGLRASFSPGKVCL